MARVVDFAWGRPSIASLRAAGAVAACRYLSYDHTGKNLTPTEAAVLTTAGIAIVSNWEAAGNWTEYSQGFAKGVQHAIEAQRQHLACGGPPDRPIYFSTDFNPTTAQLPTIADYYRGVASIIGLARTGAYGGYKTITYLFDRGVIRWGWQTYAWSDGRWDARAQLRQVRNGVNVGGVDCDLNDSTTADFGQWGTGRVVDMSISDIVPKTPDKTVGTVLSDLWHAVQDGYSGYVPTARVPIVALLDVLSVKLDTVIKANAVILGAEEGDVQRILDALNATAAAAAAARLDVDEQAIADRIADRLIASDSNPLTVEHRGVVHADILATVKQALREGTGAPALTDPPA